jgi:leucyl aminopeptidase
LEKEYPLLSAVARASRPVPRHLPRVIRIQYIASDAETDGADVQSLYLVGKGVTYDTGGADVKVGGGMMGMSRDKTGASVVAGFMYLVGLLQPSKLRVFAELGVVRNSVGSEMYVSDENIRGHSGQRVKIVNTDAEGRLVMADCLSHLREKALTAVNAQLCTIATLTGHAGRAFGSYTVLIDNGPAQKVSHAQRLASAGNRLGDSCEISSYRREDFQSIQPKKGNPSFDVIQADQNYSRSHQLANAFLIQASGLGTHGIDSKNSLAYTYIDIAPSACEDQDWKYGKSVAASFLALYGVHLRK